MRTETARTANSRVTAQCNMKHRTPSKANYKTVITKLQAVKETNLLRLHIRGVSNTKLINT